MKKSVAFVFVLFTLWLVPAAAAGERVILVVGDSLSAGYNMRLDEAWPSLLEDRLSRQGHDYRVVNSSITGDTTQSGINRLPRLLDRHNPDMVIIELGGNDGLRGFSLEATRKNLAAMIEASRSAGARVVLTGIMLPPNYGPVYTERFRQIYPALAGEYDILLVPFLLEGVALEASLMQADGIHPNADAQPLLLDNVWSVLGAVLD